MKLCSAILRCVYGVTFTLSLLPYVGTTSVPPKVVLGDATAELISTSGFDDPKISAVTPLAYDEWYFDIASEDLSTGLVVSFNTAAFAGLPGPITDTATYATVAGTFPNGSNFLYQFLAPDGADVSNNNVSAGTWHGAGFSWTSTPDMKYWTIDIEATNPEIKGTLHFNSKALAHYPCGLAGEGVSMEVCPYHGWANALPDADGEVDLTIGDTRFNFTGIGYHDKNWGARPFLLGYRDWYWGHVRVGNYSIVFYDVFDNNSVESVSAFASLNGNVLTASCANQATVVRPMGTQSGDFTVRMDLGQEGIMDMTVSSRVVILDAIFYKRWVGNATATINGGEEVTGIGLWEKIWPGHIV